MDLQDEQFLEKALDVDPRKALLNFSNAIIRHQVQKRAEPVASTTPALPSITEARFDPLVMDSNPTGQGGGGGGGDSVDKPVRVSFQAITRKISGTWKWGLWRGILYDTFDSAVPPTKLSITGLLATDLSSGFLTIPTYPADIGLDIVTDWSGASPVVTSVTVVTAQTGSGTLDVMVEYVSDGGTPPTYSQTHARIILATAIDDGNGNPLLSYNTGDKALWYTSATAYLSGGTTPQSVPCLYPF